MKDYERVSIEEAIKLTDHQTMGAFEYVRNVVQTAAQKEAAMSPKQDPLFNLMLGASVAWEAGTHCRDKGRKGTKTKKS